MIDHFNEVAARYYTPSQYIVIDEGMIPYKGKYCSFQQLVKRKPSPNGIKYWAICDEEKYLLKIEIYQGKQEGIQIIERKKFGLSGYVVLKMIEVLPKAPFVIIFDSFFTNLELVEELIAKHYYLVCTTRNPLWLFENGLHLKQKKWEFGEYQWTRRTDGLVAMSWKDSTLVNFFSYGFSHLITYRYLKRKRKESVPIHSHIPEIAKIYRTYYHAVGTFKILINIFLSFQRSLRSICDGLEIKK